MHKQTEIAVSALISIMVAVPSATATPHKRSVAMLPGAIPHMMPMHAIHGHMSAVQRQQSMQNMVRSTYPVGHFQRGMALRQRGDYDSALIEFLKAAQENPLQVRAFYEQAVIFKQKGYLKLAQSALQQALAVKPDYRDARVLLASTYLDSGDLSHAASELVASLGLNNGRSRMPALPGSTAGLEPRPVRSPSVIQTPHGMLNIFAPSKVEPAPTPMHDAFVRSATAQPEGINAQVGLPKPSESAVSDGNAFSNRTEQSDFSVNDLLKGIPGLESFAKSEPAAKPVVEAPALPAVSNASNAPHHDGVDVHGVLSIEPKPNEPVIATADTNPAQQIQEMLQEAGKNVSRLHMPNVFGFFGKGEEVKPADQPAVPELVDKNALQQTPEESPKSKKHRKRHKKHRVAAWLDDMLDGSHSNSEPVETHQRTPNVQITHDDGSVEHKTELNPLEMVVRQANEPQKSSAPKTPELPQTATVPPKSNELTNAAQTDPLAVRTVEFSHPVQLATAAGGAKESWMPTPVDISKFIKKAVSWMPLPIFKPAAVGNDQFVLPSPTLSGGAKSELPSPVLAAIRQANGDQHFVAQTLPELQANRRLPSPKLPSPVTIPQPRPGSRNAALNVAPSATMNGQAEAARVGSGALDSMLSMLPKDVAATIEQLVGPKPVDIARSGAVAPPLQRVVVNNVGPSAVAPVSAANKNVYERLVTARIGSPAQEAGVAMPAPLKPKAQPTNTPAPAPFPLPAQDASRIAFAAPLPFGATAPLPSAPLPSQTSSTLSAPPPPAGLSAHQSRGGTLPLPSLPNGVYSAQGLQGPGAASFNASAPPMTPQPLMSVRGNSPGAPMPIQVPVRRNGAAPNLVPLQSVASSAMPQAPMPMSMDATSTYSPLVTAVTNAPVEPAATVAVSQRAASTAPIPSPPVVNKIAQPSAQRLAIQGFKFVAPTLTAKQQALMTTLRSVKAPAAAGKAQQAKMAPVQVPPPEDEWAKKMKYLLANGTQSLGRGEAFMFSEETGEGVLFLKDGNTIRRRIAEPQDHEQVAMLRRPDILKPQGELQYNLSLLGKIIKRDNQPAPPTVGASSPVAPQSSASELSVNDVLGKSDSFLGWLKNVFKF